MSDRKAECCWNCRFVFIDYHVDEPYTCRCEFDIDTEKDPYPTRPDDTEYNFKSMGKFFDLVEEWENKRRKVSYGNVCDNFKFIEVIDEE
jgi:hypothetical protein